MDGAACRYFYPPAKAGIKAVNVAPDDSIAAYPQSIRNIGQLIGKSAQADKLAGKWQADMKQQPSSGKRYLFSYDGRIVSGKTLPPTKSSAAPAVSMPQPPLTVSNR